jgi:hypothetical protein
MFFAAFWADRVLPRSLVCEKSYMDAADVAIQPALLNCFYISLHYSFIPLLLASRHMLTVAFI